MTETNSISGVDEGDGGRLLLAALLTAVSEVGQVGVLAHISAVRAAHRNERGRSCRLRHAVAPVPTTCEKRKRVTEIIVETVARRIVADAVVERGTVELVVNKPETPTLGGGEEDDPLHPAVPENCQVSSWSSWGSCSRQCGTSGTQRRTRTKTVVEACGGTCHFSLDENRSCNRDKCQHSGTSVSNGCTCRPGYRGTCCESVGPVGAVVQVEDNHVFDRWRMIRIAVDVIWNFKPVRVLVLCTVVGHVGVDGIPVVKPVELVLKNVLEAARIHGHVMAGIPAEEQRWTNKRVTSNYALLTEAGLVGVYGQVAADAVILGHKVDHGAARNRRLEMAGNPVQEQRMNSGCVTRILVQFMAAGLAGLCQHHAA
ncbi:hypothetical protein OS493_032200 [Desmophyllum pertusum]|uniref:EGF-like domain-containing protein n=1 Tax=Desmophyllum pertusum TaxID=174260 RepID=A0A9W9ZWV1_9CNID|nr:hypothetical protein OS493_032200 [Desmophyllum pertusum]